MLQPDVRLHVVPPRERLPAQGAQVRLGPVDGRVVPPVADGLAADAARVQRGRLGYPVEEVAVVLGGGGGSVVVEEGGGMEQRFREVIVVG